MYEALCFLQAVPQNSQLHTLLLEHSRNSFPPISVSELRAALPLWDKQVLNQDNAMFNNPGCHRWPCNLWVYVIYVVTEKGGEHVPGKQALRNNHRVDNGETRGVTWSPDSSLRRMLGPSGLCVLHTVTHFPFSSTTEKKWNLCPFSKESVDQRGSETATAQPVLAGAACHQPFLVVPGWPALVRSSLVSFQDPVISRGRRAVGLPRNYLNEMLN